MVKVWNTGISWLLWNKELVQGNRIQSAKGNIEDGSEELNFNEGSELLSILIF